MGRRVADLALARKVLETEAAAHHNAGHDSNRSAFFGEWGERREHRAQYSGYFHRMRMFWPLAEHSFLFLCDTFGADDNGTYYKGEDGDFFVERATE